MRPAGGAAPRQGRGTSFPRSRKEPAADLEEADVPLRAAAVVGAGVDQAREQRRTEYRVLFRQRVGQERGLSARRAEGTCGRRLDEGKRHGFREATRNEGLAQQTLPGQHRGGGRLGRGQRRERRGDPIESEVTADLFDEVRLSGDVYPEPGDRHLPLLVPPIDAKPERSQDARHVARRHRLPEETRDTLEAQPYLPLARARGVAIDQRTRRQPGAHLRKERGGTGDPRRRGIDIRPALEARGRLRLQPQALAPPPHRGWMEAGALEHNPRRGGVYFGVLAAHHARHGRRA